MNRKSYMLDYAITKFQHIYFRIRMFFHQILRLPAQTTKEMAIFKVVIDYYADKNRKLKIFEWGSGFSSVHFARYLKRKGIDFEWYSVDNNKIWHEKVNYQIERNGLSQNIKLYLREFMPFWQKAGWADAVSKCGALGPKLEEEKAYINLPLSINDKFDIIIIDARFRRHCVQTAKKAVALEGVIILHDAQKPHYRIGLDDFNYSSFYAGGSWYPFQKEPNEIWIGSMDNEGVFGRLRRFSKQRDKVNE